MNENQSELDQRAAGREERASFLTHILELCITSGKEDFPTSK